VRRLLLTRLAGEEAEALVKGIATQTALAAEIIAQIVARTDGIPLFVEELTKMLLEADVIRTRDPRQALGGALAPLAIPSTLQDSLAARLDGLGTLKPLVQLCATLGREFSRALLNAVSSSTEEALDPALEQLMLFRFIKHLRDVHVDPESILYKLGIHVLLFDGHPLERRHEELEVTYVADFRLNNLLWLLPGRIAEFPHHVPACLTTIAILYRLDVEGDVQLILFIVQIKISMPAIRLYLLLRNYEIAFGQRECPRRAGNGEPDSRLV